MKGISIILFFLFFGIDSFAQSTVAKIRYEQAEEAYNNGDYRTTLVKLDEVQKILDSVNPRILYMRIMAENALVEKGNYSYGLLDSLRKDTRFYIKNYEANENLEDKFREVLALSDKLVKYPADKASYDKIEEDKLAEIRKKIVEENALLQKKRNEAKNTNRFIDSLATVFRFKPGLTKEQFYDFNAEAAKFLNETGIRPFTKGMNFNEYYKEGPYILNLGTYDGIEKVDSFMVIAGVYKNQNQREQAEKDWKALTEKYVLAELNQVGLAITTSVRESEIIPMGIEIMTYQYNPTHNYNNYNYFITIKFRASQINKRAEKTKNSE